MLRYKWILCLSSETTDDIYTKEKEPQYPTVLGQHNGPLVGVKASVHIADLLAASELRRSQRNGARSISNVRRDTSLSSMLGL